MIELLAGIGLDWARQILIAEEYGRRLSRALHGVPLTYDPNALTTIRRRTR